MALSPQALLKGIVQRVLPSFNFDSTNVDVALRQGSYGELYNQPLVRKSHNLADEGSYFVANNAQTAIAPTFNTAFTATAPFLSVYNGNATSRVYLDYAALVAAVAGTFASGGVQTAGAVVIDNGNRYSSGGTALTANSPNMAASVNASNVTIYCGAITATAASGAARTIVGQRNLRPAASATVIGAIGDQLQLNFGAVEGLVNGSVTVANPSLIPQALPPIVIGPQQSALVYLYWPGATTPAAATYLPEIGFWVR